MWEIFFLGGILSTSGDSLTTCNGKSVNYFSMPTHKCRNLNSTKWETIYMSSPGSIIMAGQSKVIIFLLLGIFKSSCNLSHAYVEDQT
jgi:hypothetical protein